MKLTTIEYIELLESALIDILDGNSNWYDIKSATGLSGERCKEIENFIGEVRRVYKKKHNIKGDNNV